jgi:hypothetical protein
MRVAKETRIPKRKGAKGRRGGDAKLARRIQQERTSVIVRQATPDELAAARARRQAFFDARKDGKFPFKSV